MSPTLPDKSKEKAPWQRLRFSQWEGLCRRRLLSVLQDLALRGHQPRSTHGRPDACVVFPGSWGLGRAGGEGATVFTNLKCIGLFNFV